VRSATFVDRLLHIDAPLDRGPERYVVLQLAGGAQASSSTRRSISMDRRPRSPRARAVTRASAPRAGGGGGAGRAAWRLRRRLPDRMPGRNRAHFRGARAPSAGSGCQGSRPRQEHAVPLPSVALCAGDLGPTFKGHARPG
jgi:hypothetical protein